MQVCKNNKSFIELVFNWTRWKDVYWKHYVSCKLIWRFITLGVYQNPAQWNFNINKTLVCTQIHIKKKNRPRYAVYTCIFKGSIVIWWTLPLPVVCIIRIAVDCTIAYWPLLCLYLISCDLGYRPKEHKHGLV